MLTTLKLLKIASRHFKAGIKFSIHIICAALSPDTALTESLTTLQKPTPTPTACDGVFTTTRHSKWPLRDNVKHEFEWDGTQNHSLFIATKM